MKRWNAAYAAAIFGALAWTLLGLILFALYGLVGAVETGGIGR